MSALGTGIENELHEKIDALEEVIRRLVPFTKHDGLCRLNEPQRGERLAKLGDEWVVQRKHQGCTCRLHKVYEKIDTLIE